MRTNLFRRPVFICQMLRAKIDQLFLAGIPEFAPCIAPLLSFLLSERFSSAACPGDPPGSSSISCICVIRQNRKKRCSPTIGSCTAFVSRLPSGRRIARRFWVISLKNSADSSQNHWACCCLKALQHTHLDVPEADNRFPGSNPYGAAGYKPHSALQQLYDTVHCASEKQCRISSRKS